MLFLRPAGRGNWHQISMEINGPRAQPLLVKVGDRVDLAGVTWRVVKVLP